MYHSGVSKPPRKNPPADAVALLRKVGKNKVTPVDLEAISEIVADQLEQRIQVGEARALETFEAFGGRQLETGGAKPGSGTRGDA